MNQDELDNIAKKNESDHHSKRADELMKKNAQKGLFIVQYFTCKNCGDISDEGKKVDALTKVIENYIETEEQRTSMKKQLKTCFLKIFPSSYRQISTCFIDLEGEHCSSKRLSQPTKHPQILISYISPPFWRRKT